MPKIQLSFHTSTVILRKLFFRKKFGQYRLFDNMVFSYDKSEFLFYMLLTMYQHEANPNL